MCALASWGKRHGAGNAEHCHLFLISQLAVSFNRQRCGKPSAITAAPLRTRRAAKIAACRLFSCFRVATGVFPASSTLQISSAVIGPVARRSVSMTALASVPRLNHGLPTLRHARDQPQHVRAEQLHDGFNLEYRQP